MKAMALAGQSCKQAECVMWNALYVNKNTGEKNLYYKLPYHGNPSHEAPVTREKVLNSAVIESANDFYTLSVWQLHSNLTWSVTLQ